MRDPYLYEDCHVYAEFVKYDQYYLGCNALFVIEAENLHKRTSLMLY